jgi:sulfatase modifying factor 1
MALQEVKRNSKDGLEYVSIPPGSFEMGASVDDGDAGKDEAPRHHVRLTRGFWLCRTPVTVKAFRRFVDATSYKTAAETDGGAWVADGTSWVKKSGTSWQNPGFAQTDDHPVVNVSWNDARAYCDWLGGRLPTEAEWEYAARAGTRSRYWWGIDMDGTCAWHQRNSEGRAQPVGKTQANPWGLFDCLGNVWEWCADWWDSAYPPDAANDPKGPPSGSVRVVRGGSWFNFPRLLRVSGRFCCDPALRYYNFGFRPVQG